MLGRIWGVANCGFNYNSIISVRELEYQVGTDTVRLEYKQENKVRTIRELTLEDIAPLWAARLGNERTFPTFMSSTWFKWCRELRCTSRCVVGEAYGYSSKYVYTCDECNGFGCKFMYYFTMNWHGKLERNKQRFLKHWSEKHTNWKEASENCLLAPH
jgi:hypothetical protein